MQTRFTFFFKITTDLKFRTRGAGKIYRFKVYDLWVEIICLLSNLLIVINFPGFRVDP